MAPTLRIRSVTAAVSLLLTLAATRAGALIIAYTGVLDVGAIHKSPGYVEWFLRTTRNIIVHSGVRLTSRIPWQGPSQFHDDHHANFHCNFGQHVMLWDRMHGTLLAGIGEPTCVPERSPIRGLPYWKSTVLRRKAA